MVRTSNFDFDSQNNRVNTTSRQVNEHVSLSTDLKIMSLATEHNFYRQHKEFDDSHTQKKQNIK